MNEWKPIETAPKDGRPVLLYQPSEGGCYLPGDLEMEDYTFTGYFDPDSYGGQWFCWEYDAAAYQPTHWMELPSPP